VADDRLVFRTEEIRVDREASAHRWLDAEQVEQVLGGLDG
jgi:hypothetical protein